MIGCHELGAGGRDLVDEVVDLEACGGGGRRRGGDDSACKDEQGCEFVFHGVEKHVGCLFIGAQTLVLVWVR